MDVGSCSNLLRSKPDGCGWRAAGPLVGSPRTSYQHVWTEGPSVAESAASTAGFHPCENLAHFQGPQLAFITPTTIGWLQVRRSWAPLWKPSVCDTRPRSFVKCLTFSGCHWYEKAENRGSTSMKGTFRPEVFTDLRVSCRLDFRSVEAVPGTCRSVSKLGLAG